MKKIYCSQFDDITCCKECHSRDEFYKTPYEAFEIIHCCSSRLEIISDIDKHSDEPLENDCD